MREYNPDPEMAAVLAQARQARRGKAAYPCNLDQIHQSLIDHAIWLEPYEMIPQNTNVGVSVLTRMEQMLVTINNGYFPNGGGGLLDPYPRGGSMDLARELGLAQNLFSTASYDPNRGESMPDVYACDVTQVEFARLNAPRRLEQVMRQMWEWLDQRHVPDPVFCITMWDYDLHFYQQQPFIDEVEHLLTKEMRVFVAGDGDLPTLEITRNQDQFHVMSTEDYSTVRSMIENDSRYPMKGGRD